MTQSLLVAVLLLVPAAASAAEPDFSYDRQRPFDVKLLRTEKHGAVEVRDLTFAGAGGKPVSAFLVLPPPAFAKAAGVLYVHWLDPGEPNGNRFEFFGEAVEQAGKGQLSLLVDAMWSDRKWYERRTHAGDFAMSERQVRDLRRAIDFLLTEPRVDTSRAALVGHDFGAMYGVLAAAGDDRIKALVLMSAAPKLSDWFLYGKFALDGEAREKYVAGMAPLDPVAHIAKLKGPVLMQFAASDFYVPREKIREWRAALPGSKPALIYDAGHGLDWQAERDRKAFLIRQLKLQRSSADIVHAYLEARNAADPVEIERFLGDGFAGPSGASAAQRREMFAFDKATHSRFEYRVTSASPDAVSVDLYHTNDFYDALGVGIRRLRVTYRIRGGKIAKVEVLDEADSRENYRSQVAAFVDWMRRERPDDAARLADAAGLKFNGTGSALVKLAEQWRK